jgi:diadenosine tetraphosphate (Ap4A) HIT family hydrolase
MALEVNLIVKMLHSIPIAYNLNVLVLGGETFHPQHIHHLPRHGGGALGGAAD